ncbi:GMC oxidoreductase [Variovorax sp. J22R133]|uniref:GMC oxidoreductase n=1 Tax=Variovorax brevis TaxID=3053503 RepID=UPI002577FBF1|nr:GMC oxidoreductase [Variovorax sp. J22R133]MDM0111666.1 GMC oxidoreductase [Variovorax sp. J22R133]
MQRRKLIKLAGAAVPSALFASSADATINLLKYRALVPEIFRPIPRPPTYTPALIIGSGFGGSITAMRLAQAGIKTTILERGSRWPTDPWREIFTNEAFPDGRGYWHRTHTKQLTGVISLFDYFGGVLDVTTYDHIDVWRAACVGGGSKVFTGVMIQPEKKYFDAVFKNSVSFEEMNRVYYPRVRQMLRLSPMPADVYNAGPFGHCRVWDDHVRKAGYAPTAVDSLFNWDVVRAELRGAARKSAIVGETDLGNANGAKFDLTQNYLKFAEATGRAQTYPGHEVRNVWYDGIRYNVDVVKLSPEGSQIDRYVLTCDYLFLAAGSIGTSELLVRARAFNHIPNLNEHVGQGWGTNGDASVLRSFGALKGITQASPCPSRISDSSGMALTLENWGTPGLPVNLGLSASLGMVYDERNRASFVYDASRDRVNLLWPKGGNDDAVAALRRVNNRIALSSFTIPGAFPVVEDVNASFTAHPLGGAVIGKATDGYGRVKGSRRLYVVDGALIPGSTGTVNPSLTISALVERNVEAILRDDF